MAAESIRHILQSSCKEDLRLSRDFCFEGFPVATMGGIYGPSCAGKSYLLLHLAAYLACGYDPTGHALPRIYNPGPVTLLTNDPESVIANRLHTIGTHLSPKAREIAGRNLSIYSLGVKDFYLGTPGILPDIKRLASESNVLILDPIHRFITGRRCDVGEMRKNLFDLEQIALDHLCNILFSYCDQSEHPMFSSFITWHCTMNALSDIEAHKIALGPRPGGKGRYKKVEIDCSLLQPQIKYFFQGEGGFLQPVDSVDAG